MNAMRVGFVVVVGFAGAARAADPRVDFSTAVRAHASVDKALTYLLRQQQTDGGWIAFDKSHPAVTALAVSALAADAKYGPEHPAVRRGAAMMLKFVQPDGGIYVDADNMPNYHTSVALLALSSLKNKAHAETIAKAQVFLKQLQWDEGEGHEASSAWYGGTGYGRSKRPDLSNTQLMLEALAQSGLPTDDPVYQKAMTFVGRCQMLGTSNDQAFALESADGGFVYSPANGGESKAGTEMVGERPRLRSYGSMTYAGFKSLLYAKVDRGDKRIQAAFEWVRRTYTLDQNPNMPGEQSKEGLYYYYHVFGRALDVFGEETIVDAAGTPHRWRNELCVKLMSLQREDGSWVNEQDRWFEGNPQLVTAYAVLAMQTALGEGPASPVRP